MKLIIAGTRTLRPTFEDIDRALEDLGWKAEDIEEVFCGCCGAENDAPDLRKHRHTAAPTPDVVGCRWAESRGIPVRHFPARWNDFSHPDSRPRKRLDGSTYNAAAGPIRNETMAIESGADGRALLFWDGKSSGTYNMRSHMDVRRRPVGLAYFPA